MRYIISAPGTAIPDVHVLRGDTGPKVMGGYGRWSIVERPKRKSATLYDGLDPIQLDVPILLDGWIVEDPIQLDINNLLRMMQEIGGEPPAVRINAGIAGGLPIDTQGIDWNMVIEWGDTQIWDFNDDGVLVLYRQDGIVHLTERVDVTTVKIKGSTGNTRGTKGAGANHPNLYTVKSGDTLTSIAIKVYHNRNRWRDIGKMNGITDPRAVKPGLQLRMPK